MFRPNLTCKIAKYDKKDGYGKRIYGPWKTTPCAIVKLVQETKKTSVRTDSSATRGTAQEILADARLLFPKYVSLKPGDRISIMGFELTVVSVFPRHSVLGNHDHWEVDFDVYGAE
jgi:hypothetical protein